MSKCDMILHKLNLHALSSKITIKCCLSQWQVQVVMHFLSTFLLYIISFTIFIIRIIAIIITVPSRVVFIVEGQFENPRWTLSTL